jgi:hypothetical protein
VGNGELTLAPDLRKFALTAHVVTSVAWVGVVASFLALAIAGLVSAEVQFARASSVAMDFTYRSAVIPLGLVSLATGIISSLGTDWVLFRHCWVLVKLLLTVAAVLLMLVHMQPVGHMAAVAAENTPSDADLARLRIQLVAYAGAALAALVFATALSTYKPRGRTGYGVRKLLGHGTAQRETGTAATGIGPSLGLKILLGVLIAMIVMFATVHLASLHHH